MCCGNLLFSFCMAPVTPRMPRELCVCSRMARTDCVHFPTVHASALSWVAGDVRDLSQPALDSHNLLMIRRLRTWLMPSTTVQSYETSPGLVPCTSAVLQRSVNV